MVRPTAIAQICDPIVATASEDLDIDLILSDLGDPSEWDMTTNPQDIDELLKEAEKALDTGIPEDKNYNSHGTSPAHLLTGDRDMTAITVDRKESESPDELEKEASAVQDIVAKLMDEVRLEQEKHVHETAKGDSREDDDIDATDSAAEFTLPSVPTSAPEPSISRASIDFEDDLAARMAALRGDSTDTFHLPSVPNFDPSDAPVKNVWKTDTDDGIEEWCIICQDDATVKCVGCDAELYCARCWKEGHTGPDAGYEARMHRWEKYRKLR